MRSAGLPSPEDPDRKDRRPLVLCVDDDAPILKALERLLRDEPYQLLTTQNPREALEVLRSRDISLVIADYRMPEMTGTELLEAAGAASPRTQRILFTGHPGETTILRGLGQGLYSLVGKPWNDEKLKELIRNALRDRDAAQRSS
jgi:DNA-binding NtrC family response regulator